MTQIDQSWLKDAATQTVCDAVTAKGAQLYFVGGCVRNALMGVPVSDLDLSTNAHPKTVIDLAKQAGLKVIPTGIDHGTVTVICDGIPFEITTFRKDVATDGRRAMVAFSNDIADDAARRDFTMNAIYARPDGSLVDPLGGMADLDARRVRFIGTAQNRIREDYLRSLRYFRFHAWYGDHEAGFDPEALAAIAANLDGLGQLSRERVGAELLKLLAADDPAPAVAAMRQAGVLLELLPGSDDRALAPLIHLEAGLKPDPIRRLAALGGPEMGEHLRLSKAQSSNWTILRDQAVATTGAAELGYRLGEIQARDVLLLRSALLEQPLSPNLETDISRGSSAKFPLSAIDLMPEITGKALGLTLKRLEADWISSEFSLNRDTLLSKLN
ncbi:CCA tRNA nucleotidyltransferase [Sedimentitalea sp. CY04]|uniref:CCA tRNA nucleotidyltransferase n=1 Tax=Parasedimentitalea denitrificans TaxID=2211118 RepID=A0ABX0W4P4_9RHOB|nr:CCA tRNA nucleotidyltransferase [Sedimentitalea sp. CY04]NIZ60608.1 CCA tRNA nucleotidyltransferase [Sedimentitalea sp. CY04]